MCSNREQRFGFFCLPPPWRGLGIPAYSVDLGSTRDDTSSYQTGRMSAVEGQRIMDNRSGQFEIRRLHPGTADHIAALHRILDVEPPRATSSTEHAPRVAELLADAAQRVVSIDLLLGAYRKGELVSACLALEAAGGSALVQISRNAAAGSGYHGTVAVLRAIQAAAWERSMSLLEVLTVSGSHDVARALLEAGFRRLTRLEYFRRDGFAEEPPVRGATDLHWVSYSADNESLFLGALEASYAQSLDCPELTGLRRTRDVLAGHRATGQFDASLWSVAIRDREPLGVILLNRIPRASALELVYMGVSPPARGTGVGDALLRRAWILAREAGVKTMALALDRRNTPAKGMYARWGFVETGVRDAWIASPART